MNNVLREMDAIKHNNQTKMMTIATPRINTLYEQQ